MRRTLFTLCVLFAAIVMATSAFGQKNLRGTKVSPSATAAMSSPEIQVQPGHPLSVEDFNYVTGGLDNLTTSNVSLGRWFTISGGGIPIQVTAGSLTYTGYTSSGVGNKIDIVSTSSSADDAAMGFPTQTSGTTYAAFMVNVANTTGLGVNSGVG